MLEAADRIGFCAACSDYKRRRCGKRRPSRLRRRWGRSGSSTCRADVHLAGELRPDHMRIPPGSAFVQSSGRMAGRTGDATELGVKRRWSWTEQNIHAVWDFEGPRPDHEAAVEGPDAGWLTLWPTRAA